MTLALLLACAGRPHPEAQLWREPPPRVEWREWQGEPADGECPEPRVVVDQCIAVALPVSMVERLEHAEGQRDRLLEAYATCADGREADRVHAQAYVDELYRAARRDRRAAQRREGVGAAVGVVLLVVLALL